MFSVPASGVEMLPLSRFTFPRESFLCPALFSVPVRVFSVPAVFAIRKSSRMAFRAAPVSLVCVCVCARACLFDDYQDQTDNDNEVRL